MPFIQKEPWWLFLTVTSPFLSAGFYGHTWPMGRGDHAAHQGQNYCTIMNQLLSIRHIQAHRRPVCKRILNAPTQVNWGKREHMLRIEFCISMEYFTAEQQLFCLSLCVWRVKAGGNLAVEKNIDQRKSIPICQMPAQDYWHLATDISLETPWYPSITP